MINLLKIKEIAKAKRIRLDEIAEAAGLSRGGLLYIMKNNSTKVETLEKIAIYLGVPISTFFEEGKGVQLTGNNIAVVNNGYQSINESQEIHALRKEIEEYKKENGELKAEKEKLLRKIIELYEKGERVNKSEKPYK